MRKTRFWGLGKKQGLESGVWSLEKMPSYKSGSKLGYVLDAEESHTRQRLCFQDYFVLDHMSAIAIIPLVCPIRILFPARGEDSFCVIR